jgi:hypothetical protein
MLDQSVASINSTYQKKLLQFNHVAHTPVGTLFTVPGYDQHNYLVEINKIFSSDPGFGLADRTKSVSHPVKFYTPRSIGLPLREYSLDKAAELTVQQISKRNCKINIFWSGGIDSTFITTAFLKHHGDHSQLRILYSPWSTYEHPEYIEFLKKFSDVELVDFSGDTYMQIQSLDGCFVTGDGGDESHASLDEKFFDRYGFETLQTSWIDFFKQHNSDSEFIEFCQWYFSLSGIEIKTVLDARWWFYIACKFYGQTFITKWPFLMGGSDNFSPDRLISFFDTEFYQSFSYHNIDKIITKDDYKCWKQFLKDYCYEFDHLENWWATHKKLTSTQIFEYSFKKNALLDQRWLMYLNDGTRISTPNLPLFSAREFRDQYGTSLDGLFHV